ncbi:MAG: GntR family transcriptional regulator [Prolixibacteraceae bacterium]
MKKVIKINEHSLLPKYRQIMDSLCQSIENGTLKKGDKIPSINQICSQFNLSRDTVMYAFNELKSKGILLSQPGKGYYLATSETHRDEKIFVLFDEFNALKEDLFNALLNSIKGKGQVEVFFHNYNPKLFKTLIHESAGRYTSYIIMPASFDNIGHLLSKLPSDRVFILDRIKPELKPYATVYQNFEQDFYDALVNGRMLLKKYMKLVFIHSDGKEPAERVKGFERFCRENNFNYQVVGSIDGNRPALYEAWFVTSDRDLVRLVKMAKEYKYKLGKKFGIVSFNDSMLKEVVGGGITTISTDFAEMGRNLAALILNHKKGNIRNPSKLIIRKSL